MKAEEKPSESTGQEDTWTTVTAEEFGTVDIEAPIRDSRNVDCWSLGDLLLRAAHEQREQGNETAFRVYGLLSEIARMHLKPRDRSEPYGPLFVLDGRRSLIPSDLEGEQSAVIGRLVPGIHNPGLRARLADIVWHNDRKCADMARQAIGAYVQAVQSVLDGNAEFFGGNTVAGSRDGCRMLCRASQIAHATGWKEPEGPLLKELLLAVIRDAVDRKCRTGFLNAGEIALDFGIGGPASLAVDAETFAESEVEDLHLSSELWEFAARAHRRNGDRNEQNRCLVAKAESLIRIADENGGEGMVAASLIRDAIRQLRNLPGTRKRRQELEEKLRHAQDFVRDEMGAVTTPFDPTKHARQSREAVGGQKLSRALAEFVSLSQSAEPEELYDEARKQAEENPFLAMIDAAVVDHEGKVVAESPGLMGGQEDEEQTLRQIILRNGGLSRQFDVEGLIEPARQVIQVEHAPEFRDIRPIIEMTPFVAEDRLDIVSIGVGRFLGGDYISAVHVLVPQLENSLRHILELAGQDTSAIQSDMTQESRPLSVLLGDPELRNALEEILGPAIVFEIENLFDRRGGPALRHDLAHGRMTAGECNGTDSVYACWFIFRLLCLPLFCVWDQVAIRLDDC